MNLNKSNQCVFLTAFKVAVDTLTMNIFIRQNIGKGYHF